MRVKPDDHPTFTKTVVILVVVGVLVAAVIWAMDRLIQELQRERVFHRSNEEIVQTVEMMDLRNRIADASSDTLKISGVLIASMNMLEHRINQHQSYILLQAARLHKERMQKEQFERGHLDPPAKERSL